MLMLVLFAMRWRLWMRAQQPKQHEKHEKHTKLKEAKAELKEAPDEEAKARAKMAIDSAQERVKSAQELVSAFTHVVARLVASSAGSCAWHGLFIMVLVYTRTGLRVRAACVLAHSPPSQSCASTACRVCCGCEWGVIATGPRRWCGVPVCVRLA